MAKNKTSEQITEWLQKRKWARAFVKNMRDIGRKSKEESMRILRGEYYENTVAAGFDWSKSPQGNNYWVERHKEFINFYYNG